MRFKNTQQILHKIKDRSSQIKSLFGLVLHSKFLFLVFLCNFPFVSLQLFFKFLALFKVCLSLQSFLFKYNNVTFRRRQFIFFLKKLVVV